MMDALLYAVRDGLRNANDGVVNNALRLNAKNCEVMADGRPTARCGDFFIAVHQGPIDSTAVNCLDELYSWSVTLTMRLSNVPPDRVGDQLLAKKMARETGFNARCGQIRAFLHMNWGLLQDANTYMVKMDQDLPDLLFRTDATDAAIGQPIQMLNSAIYGFATPAKFEGMEIPSLVGPEWFHAESAEADDVGLKAELRFGECRKFQPIATYE